MAVKERADTYISPDIELSESILNSIQDQICLIERSGIICFTNKEWNRSVLSNGGTLANCGIGANYLQQCKQEPGLYEGIQSILSGQVTCFNFEYPCHSVFIKRWFLMQATPLQDREKAIIGVVIRHVDITKQKLLEFELRKHAEQDPLTSLFNRRYFEEQLTKEVKRAIEQGTYLSLLYIDTDNFKEINDVYGHPAGDQVLKDLALQIQKAVRISDTAARIGGDEFAIILPETDPKELKLLAAKLIRTIQQVEMREQNQLINVTVSIGGKSFIKDFPLSSMIKWIDKALYSAKNQGKNQFVIL